MINTIRSGRRKKDAFYLPLTYYASVIENDSIPNNIALLLEYNIPSSTIKKIMNLIPENLSDQELVNYIFEKNIDKASNLIEYEKELLANNLINY